MIRISLGNPGSGKTACEVREMILNRSKRHVYTNINIKKKRTHPHIKLLKPEYIIQKEIKKIISSGKNKGTSIYDYTLNTDFWKSITDPINVVLDEAHTIVNARRSMSKINILVTDWLALIRRVLGQSASGYGELVLITQLPNR
ncbi:MAG: zonular occludens toxin domain-containing protein, partial [Nitrososphaeraceae archaeon]|nr:zonular occludens toxin domain-containing protein [Nitrososphaeraceae archaeon]